MTQTVFLHFVDQPTALAAFQSAGMTYTDLSGNQQIQSTGWLNGTRFDLDILVGTGQCWKPVVPAQFTTDSNGVQIPVMAQRPGYHVNMLWWSDTVAPPTILNSDIIAPGYPVCMFAP